MMKFHHIGVACASIDKAAQFVEKSFKVTSKTKIIFDEYQNVNLCLLSLEHGANIELVSGRTVEKFIDKNQFLYHSCWEVDNIEHSIESLYQNGAILISEPNPAVLFNHRQVAFLWTDIGILELLESK
jgi:methylmalonyl-CoA/ethylmalonyl-CoA epimerase